MKLLNRSMFSYITYCAIIMVAAIPILYFSIQALVANQVDQNLLQKKKLIAANFGSFNPVDTTLHSVFYEPGISFRPSMASDIAMDKFSLVMRPDSADHDNEPWRVLETRVYIHGKPFQLELSSSLLDKEILIGGIVIIVFLILLFTVTGLVLINRSMTARIWKPFYQTIEKLKNYKLEENEILYFDNTAIDEFTDLNRAIHDLTRRNEEVFQSQKSFIENTSHEMQTPVAVQQVKLDLLLQTEPLNKEQHKLLADLMDNTQRMGELHNSLLLLSKIDNRQFRETAIFSVRVLLENMVEQYRFLAELKQICIHTHLVDQMIIEANRGLIEILLGNFLSNAIRHNIPGGTVNIICMIKTVIFTNTGLDQPLEKNKMFQRFQKKSTAGINAGLGLDIAKKIADYYHYSIFYDFKDAHHNFILTVQ